MALVQEPEVQLAQRLASNEKPIRTKAVKKLRKYISVRSQKATGGFTSDELLKLWKGLFYCLWMQDKPLLQEELSNQISSLLHSFHNTDGQLLYLETFLQTFKREWTGIDRLRMDKFYQLVRFMFRQTFEILKKSDWDSSLISRFLELLTAQLLHSSSAAPMGLQFHVLDLYMTELAVVGSAELTAAQNLTFIEPFCKTAARTKDQILFRALCNSIFSTIIDQAPFAIEDLMKEIKGAQASDSDSDEDEDDDDEDDELHHLDDTDAEMQCNEDVGPVLQFDYGALADKLLALSSRSNTPSHNRKRLYKIIKVLRDLSEGIFPQDDYPEEVSTDEDDDMFGSRKRVKRRFDEMEGDDEEEGEGATQSGKKKKKKKAEVESQGEVSEDVAVPPEKSFEATTPGKKKKKKDLKKKSEKTEAAAVAGDDATTAEATETSTTTPAKKRSKKTNLKAEADEKAPQETPVVKKENQAAEKKTKGYQMPEEDVDKSTTTPAKKKKPKNKLKSTEEEDGALPQQVVEADSNQTPAKKKKNQTDELRGQQQESPEVKKKKRKIPVVFEFEADEIEAAKASNGVAQEATAAKKAKVEHVFGVKMRRKSPYFCLPEFKKTDRSLLLSPDGSSRVPFDPEQKPKCGVLKSPPTPAVRKTPTTKKKSCSTPKSTPKRRPSAADFF
uniref:Ribosomal RNA processing protein 1 homolog B-like n=1 Tax=Sphaeramia orbicularis TaxID=375764 RepID=A0A673B500_9TELE